MPIGCRVNRRPQEPGGPGKIRSRTCGPNSVTCWNSIPGSKPKPSSRIFSTLPGRLPDIQLRTLRRKIKAWRATEGPAKEVFFDQIHRPGQLAASDFTHMNDLRVTLAGEPFDHMVYHFVLTYSNWRTATVCFSESGNEREVLTHPERLILTHLVLQDSRSGQRRQFRFTPPFGSSWTSSTRESGSSRRSSRKSGNDASGGPKAPQSSARPGRSGSIR